MVSCKDMVSGEQTKLGFEETLARIQTALEARRRGTVIQER